MTIGILVLSENTTWTPSEWHGSLSLIRADNLVVRTETWQAAWSLLSQHPWTGVGVGRYAVEARNLLETSGLSPEQLRSAITHGAQRLPAPWGNHGNCWDYFLFYPASHHLSRRSCSLSSALLHDGSHVEAVRSWPGNIQLDANATQSQHLFYFFCDNGSMSGGTGIQRLGTQPTACGCAFRTIRAGCLKLVRDTRNTTGD